MLSIKFKDLSMKVDLLTTQSKPFETQVVQQAASSSRQTWCLPPKPHYNPNASVKIITLKSGMMYDEPEMLNDEATPK
jgi:hypothetical protein